MEAVEKEEEQARDTTKNWSTDTTVTVVPGHFDTVLHGCMT